MNRIKQIKYLMLGFILLFIVFILVIFPSGQQPEKEKTVLLPEVITPTINYKVKEFSLIEVAETDKEKKKLRMSNYELKGERKVKYSPKTQSYAYLGTDKLIVSSEGKVRELVFSAELAAVNFLWLDEKNILLIEKDISFQKLDRIYFVDTGNMEKEFFGGSFPVVSRFNLGVEPLISEDGKEVYFQDNEGKYWQLKMIY